MPCALPVRVCMRQVQPCKPNGSQCGSRSYPRCAGNSDQQERKLDRTGVHACLQGLLKRGRHLLGPHQPARQVRGEEERVREERVRSPRSGTWPAGRKGGCGRVLRCRSLRVHAPIALLQLVELGGEHRLGLASGIRCQEAHEGAPPGHSGAARSDAGLAATTSTDMGRCGPWCGP